MLGLHWKANHESLIQYLNEENTNVQLTAEEKDRQASWRRLSISN